jgi:hypothetical protein
MRFVSLVTNMLKFTCRPHALSSCPVYLLGRFSEMWRSYVPSGGPVVLHGFVCLKILEVKVNVSSRTRLPEKTRLQPHLPCRGSEGPKIGEAKNA